MSNPLSEGTLQQRRRVLSDALKMIASRRWSDLGRSSLAQLPAVAAQRVAGRHPSSHMGDGLALRDLIASNVDDLRPTPSTDADLTDKRWRPYLILRWCYFDGKPRDDIAAALCIDRGTYNHEQARAIDLLAERLANLDERPTESALPTPSTDGGTTAMPPPKPQLVFGRQALLEDIVGRLRKGDTVALHGLPGIGKTTLLSAVAADPRVKAHFCDGVLWATVGPNGEAESALAEWARALGVAPARLGEARTLADFARAVHDAVGEKCVLLIADDVWDEATALALRVGGSRSARLIATRSPVVAAAFGGNSAIEVPELSDADSLTLLEAYSPEAVAHFGADVRKLCDVVGGLPLALALIGSRLRQVGHAHQPRRLQRELAHLHESEARIALAQAESPLDRRAGLDDTTPTTLTSVIALSEAQLSSSAQRALYALATFPAKPNTFDEAAALVVSAQSADALDALVDAGLVEYDGVRYCLHQTIRDYGLSRLRDGEAHARFTEHYISWAEANIKRYDALAAERNNIMAALHVARESSWPDLFARGALALFRFMEMRGEYQQAEDMLEHALRAMNDAPTTSRATAWMNLGLLRIKRGEYAQAHALFEQALTLARQLDAPSLTAELLQHLGTVANDRADYAAAARYYDESLAISRAADDQWRMAEVLFYQAVMHDQRSAYDAAEACGREGLAVAQACGHREFEGVLLGGLGVIAAKRGDLQRGIALATHGLMLSREVGHKEGMALLNFVIGYAHSSLGELIQARDHYAEGLAMAREMSHSRILPMLLGAMGDVQARMGEASAGLALCDEAVTLARRAGHGHELSFVLEQRASVELQLKRFAEAEADCREAIEWAKRIESPEREAFALARLAATYAAQVKLVQAAKSGAQSLTMLRGIDYGVTQIVEYLMRNRVLKSNV
jgi:tetratricopeptide (TPR) repeat protein